MTLWRRFTPLVNAERHGIVGLLVLAVVGVGLEALLPWPLKLIVDNVVADKPLPDAVSWLAHLPGASGAYGLLAWLAVAVLALFLASQVLAIGKALLQARTSARMQFALASILFDKLQSLSLAYHRRSRRGDLVRRVTTDTGCVSALVLDLLLPLVTSTLLLAVLFSIMWHLDQLMAVVAVLVCVPMIALMRFFAPRMADRAYENEEASGHVWSVAEQTLTALPLVQAFGMETHEKGRFASVTDRSRRAYLRSILTHLQFGVGINVAEAFGIGAVMLVGGVQVLHGSVSIGTLIVALSYVAALYAPLLALAYLASTRASAMGSARRVLEVLEATDEVKDSPGAKALSATGIPLGQVLMEGVVFGYEPGRPVLHGVDFEASPGETVALVGATGAGKTSLVSLIPRFFDPWSGRVLISGLDVRSTTLSSVRDAVSIVLQAPFLLPVSIAQNIAYGRPDASMAEIEAAAAAANALEFINMLPHGFETIIGERGITLSAGQRQRLAIARAVLKNAPIVIMDEPTSALDAVTEASVMEALRRLMANRTAIVIAHRLSTIRRADRIVVLEDGQVAETGSHDALIARGGLYRKLYFGQLLRIGLDDAAVIRAT